MTNGEFALSGTMATPSGWKSQITMPEEMRVTAQEAEQKMAPIQPGEILLEEFPKPMGISQYRLAKDTNVDPRRINAIVHGERAVTADTALRLSHYFGTTARFWLNLQTQYDLEKQKDELGDRLAQEVKELASP
jgi:antitoxin HigA-1